MENTWQLASGEQVVDRYHSQIHKGAESLLPEALSRIESQGRKFFAEVVDLGRVIGENICVATSDTDEIVFAKTREFPDRMTRFVKNREPEACNSLVVILKADDKGGYILITAFIGWGVEPHPEDWKHFVKQADSSAAREMSKIFWNSHAFVWGSQEIIPGTETKICTW